MNKIAIIIPSRLDAQRLPNKPLKLINNKEMIIHVYEVAVKSNVGEVIVATPDEQIIETINKETVNAPKETVIKRGVLSVFPYKNFCCTAIKKISTETTQKSVS